MPRASALSFTRPAPSPLKRRIHCFPRPHGTDTVGALDEFATPLAVSSLGDVGRLWTGLQHADRVSSRDATSCPPPIECDIEACGRPLVDWPTHRPNSCG
jgi:hypothetical protein